MPLRKEDLEPYFFLGLIAVFGLLSLLIVLPYVYYIIGAALLVYITRPVYREFEEHVGNETVAAAASILLLLVVAVVPTLYMTDMVVQQGQQALSSIGSNAASIVDTAAAEELFLEVTGEDIDIDAAIRNAFVQAGGFLTGDLPGIVSTLLDASIGVFIMGLTMFYMFKDGDDLVRMIRRTVPLTEEQKDQLLGEMDRMTEAVLLGHVLTSTVQAIIAGIGLWAVGIPNVAFWTFIMIVLGLIPIVGNFLVWGPAGLYLIFVTGSVVPGVALLLYCAVILFAVDNWLRSVFVGGRAHIHPLIIMIGVIGGLPMFGLLGVVLGPLTLGFFTVLLRVYHEDFGAV